MLILIVGLCLFNRVEATARLLGRAAVVVARDPAATLTALTTPQSGEAVVGPRVMLLLRVLRAVSPPSFRFALSAVAHETDAHDLCEAAYPLRVVGDSPFVLLSTAEPLPAGCAIVHREEDVALARCL